MTFKMVSSLRVHATIATFLGLPALPLRLEVPIHVNVDVRIDRLGLLVHLISLDQHAHRLGEVPGLSRIDPRHANSRALQHTDQAAF